MFILIFIYVCYILGAMNGNVPTSSDLNDYKDFCTKRANFGAYTNKPDTMQSGNGWGVLMVYKVDNNTVVQIIYNESHRRIHYRHWYDGVWQTWDNQELNIPDFYKDYANLSSLANALGVSELHCEIKIGSRDDNPVITFERDRVGFVIITTTGMHLGKASVYFLSYYGAPRAILNDEPDASFTVDSNTSIFTVTDESYVKFFFIGL